MVTPISLEWAGSRGMMSLIIIVRSGVTKRTSMIVLLCENSRIGQQGKGSSKVHLWKICGCSCMEYIYMYWGVVSGIN